MVFLILQGFLARPLQQLLEVLIFCHDELIFEMRPIVNSLRASDID